MRRFKESGRENQALCESQFVGSESFGCERIEAP
jgi:hypothetical protein